MHEKGVWVDDRDAEPVEDLRGKIFEIERHDAIDMARERGCEDMDVVLVRQRDARQPVPPSTLRVVHLAANSPVVARLNRASVMASG